MPSPQRLVRELWAAIDAQDAAAVRPLIHPEARLEMAMAQGVLVEGSEEVMSRLTEAWKQVHSLRLGSLHEAGDDAVIVQGRSRYPLPKGGFADSRFVWLCQWREGMLWRQWLFASVEDAREAAAKLGDSAVS